MHLTIFYPYFDVKMYCAICLSYPFSLYTCAIFDLNSWLTLRDSDIHVLEMWNLLKYLVN